MRYPKSGDEGFFRRADQMIGANSKANPDDFKDSPDLTDSKIAYVIRHSQGMDVLDLGCVMHDPQSYRSKYWVHKALLGACKSVVGMDLSKEGADFLRGKGYQVLHGDAQDFSLGQKFDVIHAGDLLEHLEDFSGFFECCIQHLRRDGRIIVSTPNPWYWRNIIKSILYMEVSNNPEHTCWLCPRTLRQLAKRHGFELQEIEFCSRYWRDKFVPFPRGIRHTSWNAVLRLAVSGL